MTFKVIQGDAIETMRGLPSASVDACITDPPYGTTACAWDSVIPFAPMWAELKRIVKPKGAIVLFCSQPFTSALVMSNPAMFKYEWMWEKEQGVNFQLVKYQPLKLHESICVFFREQPTYNPQGVTPCLITKSNKRKSGGIGHLRGSAEKRDFYSQTSCNYPVSVQRFNREVGLHPTQKPVDLLRYLVRTYTNAGDTVLDFTCGSGTTGLACEIEGRNSINVDSDGHYCEVSRARMTRAQGIPCDIPKQVKQYAPAPLFEAVA